VIVRFKNSANDAWTVFFPSFLFFSGNSFFDRSAFFLAVVSVDFSADALCRVHCSHESMLDFQVLIQVLCNRMCK